MDGSDNPATIVVNADGTAIGSGAALGAGSAVIGKVGIDQTTPGTTNAVSNLGTGVMVATTSTAVASTAADVQVIAATPNLRLMGYSFQENAGTAASFVIRNGTTASDTPLAYVALAAGESVRDWFGPNGKIAAAGIFFDRVTGTIIGQVDTMVVA